MVFKLLLSLLFLFTFFQTSNHYSECFLLQLPSAAFLRVGAWRGGASYIRPLLRYTSLHFSYFFSFLVAIKLLIFFFFFFFNFWGFSIHLFFLFLGFHG